MVILKIVMLMLYTLFTTIHFSHIQCHLNTYINIYISTGTTVHFGMVIPLSNDFVGYFLAMH